MAPKKPNPVEEPPAASSDEDEEEEEETEEEETSSSEEGEEDDEETPEQAASTKRLLAAATEATQSTSSISEDGSGSESDSEPEPTPKPIETKPMEETPKSKPRPKPASKRENETERTQKDAKRVKKEEEVEEEALESKDTAKKQQRLWSEDDEIAVLKGMIEFSTKKGVDPNSDMNGFHDFIKKSLHVDVSRNQLVDKIRRLKKKYENNVGIKEEENKTFSKPHERKAYELSKKVWGGEARKVQKQRGNSKQLSALKAELINGLKEEKIEAKMEVENEKESSLNTADVEKHLCDVRGGVAGLEGYVIENGLGIIGGLKKEELEGKWRKLQIARLELYLERSDLVREQAVLVLEAMKANDKCD